MSNENETMISVAEYISKYQVTKLVEDAVNECYKSQSTDVNSFFVKLIFLIPRLNIFQKVQTVKTFQVLLEEKF